MNVKIISYEHRINTFAVNIDVTLMHDAAH